MTQGSVAGVMSNIDGFLSKTDGVTFYFFFYRANPASGFFPSQANLYYSLCQHLPDDRTEEIKYFLLNPS